MTERKVEALLGQPGKSELFLSLNLNCAFSWQAKEVSIVLDFYYPDGAGKPGRLCSGTLKHLDSGQSENLLLPDDDFRYPEERNLLRKIRRLLPW
jgi:hypothetical protein